MLVATVSTLWLVAPCASAAASGSAPTAVVASGTALPPLFPSSTSLLVSPDPALTNEPVTMIATVTSTLVSTTPSGTMVFEDGGVPIVGCSDVAVLPTGQTVTVTCQTSFAASTAQLEAVFEAAADGMVAGSSSPIQSLDVGPDSTVVSIDAPSPANLGVSTTYTAAVTASPAWPGPVQPTGAVEFLDGGQPIASCLGQQISNEMATCTVTYVSPGMHAISARYLGDANFTGATSPIQQVTAVPATPQVLGVISATMQWTFFYTPLYTEVRALVVSGATGASVRVKCTGAGCPPAKRLRLVTSSKRCGSSVTSPCQPQGRLDLTPAFRSRRLSVGAKMTVSIARPGWIGKVYTFVVRAAASPRIQITCRRPGMLDAQAGC
jgi:Bacterial Ig-like domain (group 3)